MEFVARLKDEADKFSARMRRKAEIAQEADSELNIAQAAVAMDSVEGDMQTNNYMVGWNAEVKRLEELAAAGSITAAQEQRLRHVRRNIATIRDAEAVRHPTPENMAGRRLAELGPVGRVQGLLGGLSVPGMLMSPATWVLAAFSIPAAWGAVQTARLNHAKHDLAQAIETANHNAAAAHEWQERSEHYRQGLIDAANVADQAAHALTAERAAHAAAAARERRRVREIQNVLAGVPDAPAWELRDDHADHPSPGASGPS